MAGKRRKKAAGSEGAAPEGPKAPRGITIRCSIVHDEQAAIDALRPLLAKARLLAEANQPGAGGVPVEHPRGE